MPKIYTAKEKRDLASQRGIVVDEQDEWLLYSYTWYLNAYGYAVTFLPREFDDHRPCVFLHHCIVGQPIWDDDEVDHRDRNRTNNRRDNLRYVNGSEQMMNHGKALRAMARRNNE